MADPLVRKAGVELASAKRALIIGLDAASPPLVMRFYREGCLPHIGGLIERGAFTRALPCAPVWTPTNWTTVATGAYPGTHGIFHWGTHRPGEPLTDVHAYEAMSSNLCQAEYLWEAAARADRRSVLLYFVGYPPTTDHATYFDWFLSPSQYHFELSRADCHSTLDLGRGHSRVSLAPAGGWDNLPESARPPLETVIEVKPKRESGGPRYHALIVAGAGGYDRLLLCRARDAAEPLASLSVGEWSPWQCEPFQDDGRATEGTVRFKLVELSPDAERLRLYQSQVFPIDEMGWPAGVGREVIERVGPYVQEEALRAVDRGWLDDVSADEEFGYQADWLGRAAQYLVESRDAALFFLHWHHLDSLEHRVLSRVDPIGGDYDPDQAEHYWQALRDGYQRADHLVGELTRAADEDTLVVVCSDHGNAANRKRASPTNLLREHGLMAAEPSADGLRVDWARTKAVVNGLHIYVNLKGRDPQGIVEPEDYDSVCQQVIGLLRGWRDDDGEHPIAVALRKQDAPMIGFWGDGIGDVVFMYSGGFAWEQGQVPEGKTVVPGHGANHGPQLPTTETGISSNSALLLMSGPGVRRGHVRNEASLGPARLVDLAPTVAHLLDIPSPAQSQGQVLSDMLDGYPGEIVREPRPLPLAAPEAATDELRYATDVTDQI